MYYRGTLKWRENQLAFDMKFGKTGFRWSPKYGQLCLCETAFSGANVWFF